MGYTNGFYVNLTRMAYNLDLGSISLSKFAVRGFSRPLELRTCFWMAEFFNNFHLMR